MSLTCRLAPQCPRLRLRGSKAEEEAAASTVYIPLVPMSLPVGAIEYKNIPYVTDGHERQVLDLYIPRHVEKGLLLPLILFIHGGRWQFETKEEFKHQDCEYYLQAGYAVASADFRLVPEFIFPSQVQDLKAALRWLRAHAAEYQLDPQRFGSVGASSAGNSSAMLGTTGSTREFDVGENLDQCSCVQAVVEYYAGVDFSQMDAHMIPGGDSHDAADSVESMYIGGPIQENLDIVARANPITYISACTPPFLICHGDLDREIPHHQSVLLSTALRAAGIPTSFYTVEGAGHEPYRGRADVEALTRLFFAKVLQPGAYCQP